MDGYAAYQNNTVLTASKGQLLVLLYEGAIRFLKRAVLELEAGKWDEKGKYIVKGVDVINELNVSLNMEVGGEVAKNLRSLYLFMVRHLGEANIEKDAGKVQHVISLLQELLSAWRQIVEEAA